MVFYDGETIYGNDFCLYGLNKGQSSSNNPVKIPVLVLCCFRAVYAGNAGKIVDCIKINCYDVVLQ